MDSELPEFKDWIEIKLKDEKGNPIPDEYYNLYLPDGKVRRGKLDENGYTKEKDIPPGRYKIAYPNLKGGGKIDSLR